ncbi:hypothetical protein GCM10009727_63140 [Actinomadura napierensis]|uniref:Uncharacterized protein n=1 Tax=Actinomadura napierensis TaxID=267854 RepID=A0ABN3A703_9ACTN
MTKDHQITGYVCAFCTNDIPMSSPDLRRLNIETMDGFPSQELFAHRACLARAISPEIPLGEVLDEDP